MGKRYFGTDGIRGRTNEGAMTAQTALAVGQAAGRHFLRGSHRHRVVIGKDTRLSGYMIENALVAGFTSVGMDVVLTGPLPTPAIALLTRELRADVGVMISASHNPYEDNGIKLFGPDGFKLSDADEAAIEAAIDAPATLAPAAEIGRARRIDDAAGRYIHAVKSSLPDAVRLDGLKIVVDEAGATVDGDQIMALIGSRWAAEGRLAGGAVVATVMSNLGLERFLKGQGIDLIRTAVGDRHVLEAMRARGCNVGGEQSGHMILLDHATTGDGTVAALQVLAALVQSGKRASELLHLFDPVPQLLRNVRFSGGQPLEAASVKTAIAEAEASLNGSGRLVIRASGTEPLIRVMAEGDDAGQVEAAVASICAAVEEAAA
jgi:phosphoglucosamine mutase